MSKITLAIMDADSVLGRELIDVLRDDEARWFSDLKLFGSNNNNSFVRFENKDLQIEPFTKAAFDGVDIALLAGAEQVDAGAIAVGVATLARDMTAPVVCPTLNPENVDDHRGLIYVPDGPSIAIARLAKAIDAIESIAATILQPASLFGPKGIEELYAQARALFNNEPMPDKILGGRLAYNILPGQPIAGLDALTTAPCDITSLLVPVFGGTVITSQWQLMAPISANDLAKRIETTAGLDLAESVEPADVVGQSEARVTIHDARSGYLRITAAIDEVRCVADALYNVGREIVRQDAF